LNNASSIFFKVIPDENDVENILSESHWPFLNNIDTTEPYPVAQEHLEISTTRSQIRHKRINEYFLGYDKSTCLYRLPHKLRYCFPNNSAFSSLPIVYTTPSLATDDDIDKATQDKDGDCNDEDANALLSDDVNVCNSEHDDDKGELVKVDEQSVEYLEKQVLKEQSIVYNKIDCFLVDLWRTLKASFAESNSTSSTTTTTTSCNTVSVNDLMVLLRHANSLENSLLIEGLLSLIWLTHENSDLNKLMRLSMINAQCGNVDNAITIINKVIERDPTYVEAHTKRAIYLYTLKKFQDSAISAKKALGKL